MVLGVDSMIVIRVRYIHTVCWPLHDIKWWWQLPLTTMPAQCIFHPPNLLSSMMAVWISLGIRCWFSPLLCKHPPHLMLLFWMSTPLLVLLLGDNQVRRIVYWLRCGVQQWWQWLRTCTSAQIVTHSSHHLSQARLIALHDMNPEAGEWQTRD